MSLTKRNRNAAEMIEEVRSALGDEIADALASKLGVARIRRDEKDAKSRDQTQARARAEA